MTMSCALLDDGGPEIFNESCEPAIKRVLSIAHSTDLGMTIVKWAKMNKRRFVAVSSGVKDTKLSLMRFMSHFQAAHKFKIRNINRANKLNKPQSPGCL